VYLDPDIKRSIRFRRFVRRLDNALFAQSCASRTPESAGRLMRARMREQVYVRSMLSRVGVRKPLRVDRITQAGSTCTPVRSPPSPVSQIRPSNLGALHSQSPSVGCAFRCRMAHSQSASKHRLVGARPVRWSKSSCRIILRRATPSAREVVAALFP
jgi:hypothetical protein